MIKVVQNSRYYTLRNFITYTHGGCSSSNISFPSGFRGTKENHKHSQDRQSQSQDLNLGSPEAEVLTTWPQ